MVGIFNIASRISNVPSLRKFTISHLKNTKGKIGLIIIMLFKFELWNLFEKNLNFFSLHKWSAAWIVISVSDKNDRRQQVFWNSLVGVFQNNNAYAWIKINCPLSQLQTIKFSQLCFLIHFETFLLSIWAILGPDFLLVFISLQ